MIGCMMSGGVIDERSYREILDGARSRFPSSAFLKKCEIFYKENRFLSQKQIDKLDGLKSVSNLAKLYTPQTEEEILEDLVSCGLMTREQVEAGEADDIIDEYMSEDFETWKD